MDDYQCRKKEKKGDLVLGIHEDEIQLRETEQNQNDSDMPEAYFFLPIKAVIRGWWDVDSICILELQLLSLASILRAASGSQAGCQKK